MDLKKLVKQMDSENPCFIAYQDDNAYKCQFMGQYHADADNLIRIIP